MTNWIPFVQMVVLVALGAGLLVVNKLWLSNPTLDVAGAGLIVLAAGQLHGLFQSPTKQ